MLVLYEMMFLVTSDSNPLYFFFWSVNITFFFNITFHLELQMPKSICEFEALFHLPIKKKKKRCVRTSISNFCPLLQYGWGFPGGAVVKNLPDIAGDARDRFDPWVRKISQKCQPAPVFLPEKSHGHKNP